MYDVVGYLVFGVERGASNTPHLQGYIQFKVRRTLAHVKATLGSKRYHLEIARGSAEEADEYCRKEAGEIFERGTISHTANERRKRAAEERESREEQCKAIAVAVKAKKPRMEIMESYPHLAKYVNLLSELRPKREKAPEVLYIYSATGVGKTTTTKLFLEQHKLLYYFKPSATKWWPGYDCQQVVVLEEFTSCFPCTQFLQLCDSVQYTVEIKGGHIQFDSPYIIILTNLSREEQYQGVPPKRHAAFKRRCRDCHEIMESGDPEEELATDSLNSLKLSGTITPRRQRCP